MLQKRGCLAAAAAVVVADDGRSCFLSLFVVGLTQIQLNGLRKHSAKSGRHVVMQVVALQVCPNWRSMEMQCSAAALLASHYAIRPFHSVFACSTFSFSHPFCCWPAGSWLLLSLKSKSRRKRKREKERVRRRPIKLTPSSLIFSLGSNLLYLLC